MWRCSLAFLVPLRVFQQGFPIEIWYRGNRWRSKLALLVRETICGLKKIEVQRHKIKRRRGLSDESMEDELWELFFFNPRDLLFLDWACAIFLFSISEPICDKLVLNRNKWCHFPSQNVCVCHSTASFMIHPLSFLSLFCNVPPHPPTLPNMFCVFVFVLCASCCVLMSDGVVGVPYMCFRSALLQSLVLFTVNKRQLPGSKLMGYFKFMENKLQSAVFNDHYNFKIEWSNFEWRINS